jgi:uncharacterized phiE125 gp8 family phage protein
MLKLVEPPAVEPITIAELKLYLRIDHSVEDDLLGLIIKTARQHVEMITNRALILQKWEWYLDDWWEGILNIPRPPLISVDQIKYRDENGTELPFTDYRYDAVDVGRLWLADGASFPPVKLYQYGGVKISFTAGYGSSGVSVPEPIRHAIRLLAGHYYENREAVLVERGANIMQLPMAVEALLSPYRVWIF